MKLYIVHNYVWCEEDKPLAIFYSEEDCFKYIRSRPDVLFYCARIYTYDMDNVNSYRCLKEINLNDMTEININDENEL